MSFVNSQKLNTMGKRKLHKLPIFSPKNDPEPDLPLPDSKNGLKRNAKNGIYHSENIARFHKKSITLKQIQDTVRNKTPNGTAAKIKFPLYKTNEM